MTPGEVAAPWSQPASAVADALGVDPATGLDAATAATRLAEFGPNELAEARRTPRWRRFAAQFTDRLILILLAAAAVALLVSREVKTPAVVLLVVVVNATVGYIQEGRAEAALDALRRLMVPVARVRRDATVVEIAAAEVVVGDVVVVDAGDRVCADGRLVGATQLEVDESALTGETLPVPKATAPEPGVTPTLALAERRTMVHANTTVTRGHGEFVVTATGMATEVGTIAGLLASTDPTVTPLQRQLDGLARNLAMLAGVIVAVVAGIGLLRGESVSDVLLTGVALAVASIPEGLPAVTALTLALGVGRMARRNAIVKRMASVETLGCTDVVCTDKTGTLTLNQMTAQALVLGGVTHAVTGHGYGPAGTIEGIGVGDGLAGALAGAVALCSDAVVVDDADAGWMVVGDPTEGALVVLAGKAGVDVAGVRAARPRLGELPFDSAVKFMATVHADDDGGVVLFAKGAIDVLVGRAGWVADRGGSPQPVAGAGWVDGANHALASEGMRVLAVGRRRIPDDVWAAVLANTDDTADAVAELVNDLEILGLVGIVDPARPEAAAAIAEAHSAGMRVRMITGDHAVTAGAIATSLGLADRGEPVVVTGADLDAMDDDELDARLGLIDVYARVSPQHKLRLVEALQRNGEVVAMTGDGVNDAPALRAADIGVAMGVTGTEVSKEAATMVLADDNFATIVAAVREGRAIYDNIVKFVRFQLSTTLGFAALFLAAAVFGVAGGKPFTAIAILWVNIIMDGPPALSLGLDPGAPDLMRRRPRPLAEKILTPSRWVAIGLAAAVMAAGSLAVLAVAPGPEPTAGGATVAGTMAFTTFVAFQFFNILNARSDHASVFTAATFTNYRLWVSLALVAALQVAVVHVGWFQDLFDTTSLSASQWVVCVAVASSVLWIDEVRKLVVRRHG